jgi:TRAP-type transport system periplasmic protein
MVPWPAQIVYSKKEIAAISDAKGLKLRTSNKSTTDFYAAVGANPVQLPWSEVVPSLASGAIEGVATSSSSGVDGKFWEFLKYVTKFNDQSSSNMVTVNLDAWRRLTPEQREGVEDLARQLEAEFWTLAIEDDKAKLAELASHGMKISDPTPEMRAQLIKIAEPMWQDFAKQVPEAAPVIAAYRQLVGK